MTRFARVGQNRKRAHDATTWDDLKGKSKQNADQHAGSEPNDQGANREVPRDTPEGGGVNDTSSMSKGHGSANGPNKGEKRHKFEKGKHFNKRGKMKKDFECYNCKGKDHKASECPQPSDGKNDNIVCHACKELGHKAFRCPNSQGSENKWTGVAKKSDHKRTSKPQGFGQKRDGGPGKFNKQNRPLKDAWSKEKRSEWRRQKRENEREGKKHCFNCRSAGHQLSDCPELQKDVEQGTGICFKCGSTEHKIHQCSVKVAKDKFPFAKCFICNETGHLSKQCPDNPRGLYPDGGCCKQCGSVEHLKRDCPEIQTKQDEKCPLTYGEGDFRYTFQQCRHAKEKVSGIGDMTLGRLNSDISGDTQDVPFKKMKKTHIPSGPKVVTF